MHGQQSNLLYIKISSVIFVSKRADLGLTSYGFWSQASVLSGVCFSSGFCLILGGKS